MISFLYNLFTRSFIVLLVAMLSVNYLPDKLFSDYPFEPKAVDTNHHDSIILEWNSKLTENSKLEYIQLNQIRGPESIALKNGLLYTGLADGRLIELDPSKNYKIREVLKFNDKSPNCINDKITHVDECGRFLQMRVRNDSLFAIEVNNGLYQIDTVNGKKTLLGPKKLNPINIYNSFAFDPKMPNIAYITTSSTKWRLQQIVWSAMELESSGQIIALDINTGKRVVLLSGIMLPNGIDVDVKRDQLIFAEFTGGRISSLSLKDARAAFQTAKDGSKLANVGRATVIPSLPGTPDNIIIDSDIAYIALPLVKPNGKDLLDHLANKPSIRKAIGRFIFGAGKIIEYICENLYHHPLLDQAYRVLKSGHILYSITSNDKSGLIVYNLDTGAQRFLGSGDFSFLSEAIPDGKGNLYLGSFRSPFIVKVKGPLI